MKTPSSRRQCITLECVAMAGWRDISLTSGHPHNSSCQSGSHLYSILCSMTSSLSAVATHAHKTPATSSVCTHLLLLDQFEEMLVPCSLKTTTDPPLSAAKAELPCGPRDSRHHHPAAEDNRSKARVR